MDDTKNGGEVISTQPWRSCGGVAVSLIVAASDLGLSAVEQVVEPVLGVVVVDAPALAAEDDDLLLAVLLERREVRRDQLHVNAQVQLPLCLQVLGALGVAAARVVAILEALDLATVRVPLRVEGLGRGCVELRVRVTRVAELALA